MAHIIYTSTNEVYKIVETDAHKDAINGIENYNAVSISDSDFAKIKKNELRVGNYDADNSQHSTTVVDVTELYNINSLSSYLEEIKKLLKNFCEEPSNNSNLLFTICNNYLFYLTNEFNVNAHDFTATPIYSWEKYCEDNSISYINPLQIP